MEKIRTVIIDDEPGSIKVLKDYFSQFKPEVDVTGEALTVKDGIAVIKRLQPQLVFLDISLPDGDGFQVLDQSSDIDFEVVFTTAYSSYMEKAFDNFALHYLLKPIDFEKLDKTIERFKNQNIRSYRSNNIAVIKETANQKSGKIPLPVKSGYVLVDIKDIVRCEGVSNYTNVVLKSGEKHLIAKTLKHFTDLLSGNNFYRLHKSHLVNTDYIREIKSDGSVTLTNNDTVAISQRSKKDFFSFLRQNS